jgi:hypothetical protein
MHRPAVAMLFLLAASSAVAQNRPVSDPLAVTFAQKSVAALTGGTTVGDVTLNANVTSILGSDYESGTGTFQAKGTGESRVDLNLSSSGTRSDVRNQASGSPGGSWAKNGSPSTSYADHNCLVDAAWFFPALSSLSQTANPSFVLKYIGQEPHGGVSTQHIQVFQWSASDPAMPRLSAMDFYLSVANSLPVALDFKVHSDSDMNVDIPVEIGFANYQSVNGIEVPFHVQRMLNGEVVLDITVTNAAFNTGLADSLFVLP